MPVFYILFILLFLSMGIYYLFFQPIPIFALHYLLFALYFFILLNHLTGHQFKKELFLVTMSLFVADGFINIIFAQNWISGIISFFLAYSSWEIYQRIKRGKI